MIGGDDLVSIADVGLGVSQVLPVLVGLRLADPHQLVYIEQPEIHLHPRAQHALAKPFAEAAKREVTTVVETHSSLFLLGIQSLIAKGQLDPSLVILHWFERDPKTGISEVISVTPDKTGVFENWPVDFDDVSLQANREFIKASFAKTKSK
jgi:predicted ATPase